jgi:hypothetical protein
MQHSINYFNVILCSLHIKIQKLHTKIVHLAESIYTLFMYITYTILIC